MRPALIDQYRKPSLFTELEDPSYTLPSKGGNKASKRLQLFHSQEGKCLGCDKPFSEKRVPTLDHVIPKKRGGSNDIKNLILLCPHCNSLKGDIGSFEEAALDAADIVDKAFQAQNIAMNRLAIFKRLKDKGIVK